ncbi:MAG: helix-turn-helix transcriptional regulator [Clostridia bacterium]|nr:helix-turn-helix transcriptional regulator [Clostridia bacterium]
MEYIEGEGFSLSHTITKSPNDNDFEPHIHENYELLCVVKGDVSYIVEGHKYKLSDGALMLMRSSETHKLIVDKSTEYERYVLSFSPSLISKIGLSRALLSPFKERSIGEKNLYLPEEFKYIAPTSYFERAFNDAGSLDEKDIAISLLAPLLCEIKCAFDNKEEFTIRKRTLSEEIIAYINDNLKNDITIGKIANSLHTSQTQVSRVFKKSVGASVYDYVLTKRLILFNKRLSKGKNIQELARECGFHDYSSFYRLYKKRFGISPASSIKNKSN